MATLRERWILSILLVHLQTRLAATGGPAPPSHLECFKPCDEKSCSADIHCTWDPGPDPQITTNYSLHWEPTNSEQGHVPCPTSSRSIIPRQHFLNHGELHVWVEAKNKNGFAKSRENVFNTADIIKPPPPSITLSQQEPLEIGWRFFCDELHLSMGTCEVRNRVEGNQVWLKPEDGYHHTYTLESPLPDTFYEFQVRCSCLEALISDWSTSHRIRSAEKAPVGKLDIWMDCGLLPASFGCSLTWKTLPLSQACGAILGYKVKLFYNNSSWTLLNLSPAETTGPLLCNEMLCRLTSSLKDVSSVSASAFNSRGATASSHLAMPTQGKDVRTINLKMNEENLTVAWELPSKPLSKLTEYVVQYKQLESRLGQGFDWVKVTNNRTTVFFKGHFIQHTPFQVSLFTLSHDSTVHYLSSAIGYSLEGIPSSVPSFQAQSIAATWVTLFWTAVPLSKQNGLIHYQIGLGEKNVNTVRVSPLNKNGTFTLKNLSPGQEYEVWITAVTKAGPGAKTTTTFKTKQRENYDLLKIVLLPVLFMGLICFAIVCFCLVAENKMCPQVNLLFSNKVPDPRNSNIFRGMKYTINDPFGSISIPIPEPHPNISVLEFVKIQPDAFKSTPKETSDQEEQRDDAVKKECGRMDHSRGREEYSKMVDSDEERDREEDKDDCWSSSEEEQFTSGYEKHFMPAALEILDV